jgi:signal transduction histidine kinase/DNA-binding NarL/FixJ family response regulator
LTKRVLIADDEPLIRCALDDYLTDCGYETATAADGREVLSLLRDGRFDIALLDLRMPQVQDVIAALAEELPSLPVVVVAATERLADAVQAMRSGAWGLISKPLGDMSEVPQVIEHTLDRVRLVVERGDQQESERLTESVEVEVLRQTSELRAQNRRLTAMNRVAHAVSHALEFDTMLSRALGAVLTAVEAESGVVQLLNPATSCLYVAAAQGFSEEQVPYGQPLPLGRAVAGRTARDGHVMRGRVRPTEECLPGLDLSDHKTYAFVPLRASDSSVSWDNDPQHQVVVGLLGVFSQREQAFHPDELDLLTAVGSQLGVAVTRAQYAADLRRANLQLETANEELKRLDSLRAQFIQNVTHELRTPLALVRGYVELLADGGLTDDSWAHAMQVTKERTLALVELVEAITTLQDLDTAPLVTESVSAKELIRTACRMANQRVIASKTILRCEEQGQGLVFQGDFSRLAQALYQLLDNACKFTDPGQVVTVSAGVSSAGDYAVISVRDQGIGIAEEEQTRIFDRFYQIDGSATRRYGGTGLGLALVREIVEAHAGWVRVESQVGQGSTFMFGLPLEGT